MLEATRVPKDERSPSESCTNLIVPLLLHRCDQTWKNLHCWMCWVLERSLSLIMSRATFQTEMLEVK